MTRPSMRSSRNARRFGVFDFTEDDDRVEKEAKKLLGKFGVTAREASCTVDKYDFLRCFTGDKINERKELLDRVIDIEDETANKGRSLEKEQAGRLSSIGACVADQQCIMLDCNSIVSSDKGAHEEGISGWDTHLHSTHLDIESQVVYVTSDDECERSGTASLKRQSFGSSVYETNETIDFISYDGGPVVMNSSTSTSSADDEVLSGQEALDCAPGAHEIDAENLRVLIIPDVIIYGDVFCTKSRVTFSCNFIEVEGLAVNAAKEAFSCQWAVEHIIKIESEWCLEVETAIVNFLFKPKDCKGPGCAGEASGIDLLKFAVYDPCWSEALEAIKSLDIRYKDVWNDVILGSNDNTGRSQISGTIITNRFESFEDIIYPQGDSDAILISKKDIGFLQPGSFINDTIIDFYIKYLKNQIQPEKVCKFHFFNCFFFHKLANLDKGSPSTSEGREAFQRVKKWTKKVDIFGKDYIFIPVNYSFHWSLIVICHPGEAINFNDDEAENSPRVPCILHMDSMKGSHRGLKNLFPSYLSEEWKERHGDKTNDPSRVLNLRFIPLELPQQENSFDCGLFLLHYLELFLAQAPASFSPFNITKSTTFLTRNWFPPADASLKRGQIRDLLYSLQEGHSQNIVSADCSSSWPPSEVPGKIGQEYEIEILTEIHSSRKRSDVFSSITTSTIHAETLPSAMCSSPVRESSRELPNLILSKERFCTGSDHREASMCQRVFMSPIEEVQESCEKASVSPKVTGDSGQMAYQENPLGTADHRRLESSRNNECTTLYIEDSDNEDSVSVTSIPESPDSSEVQLSNNDLLLITADSKELNMTRKSQCPTPLIETFSDCVVEDFLEQEVIDKGGNEIKDSASSFVSTDMLPSRRRTLGKGHALKEKEPLTVSQLMEKHKANRKRQKTCSS